MFAPDAPCFQAPAGRIVGWREGAVVRATGIRYARAERFGRPLAEPAATTPILATAPAPACPQLADPLLDQVLGNLLAPLTYSEDCLRLSLTLPADLQPTERLPVVVWVHGGSYVSGAGDLPLYDPARLVSEQRVVFVAVTYRLGLLGFLGTAGGTPPNLGLLDLLAALRWVQRNGAAFGGDPALVTLLGHSSGADACAQLLLVPEARGLFRRVILHSAPLGLTRHRQALTRALQAAAGPLSPTAPIGEVLGRERAVVRAARWFGLKGAMPFGPQYGAPPLPPEADVEAAWVAAAPPVDVLIGTTAEETRFFAVISPRLSRLGRLPLLGRVLLRLLVTATSRRIYQTPAQVFARRHARGGGRAYLFEVDYAPPGSAFGAAHVVDLPLLLGTPESWAATPLLGQASWEAVQAAGHPVRQLWADFARTGVLPARLELPGVLRLRQV
ncbi:MAG: carboxylesterase family protein [Janthinobacterium lividum]